MLESTGSKSHSTAQQCINYGTFEYGKEGPLMKKITTDLILSGKPEVVALGRLDDLIFKKQPHFVIFLFPMQLRKLSWGATPS